MKRNENKKSLTKKIVAGTGLALLLALVGYTGANTYAKYIKSTEVTTQSATVAKWGYVVNSSAANLFGSAYENDTKVDADKEGVEVKAAAETLAPGTQGHLTVSVNGSAEVLSSIAFTVSSTKDVFYNDGTKDYRPVKWNVTGDAMVGSTSFIGNFSKDMTTAQLVDAMNMIQAAKIAPNTNVSINLTVTWDWDFHVDVATDKLDTILGHLASSKSIDGGKVELDESKYSTQIDLALKVEVVQLDKAA